MIVQKTIENKLASRFITDFLSVENESHHHAVAANSETHFKVTLVSAGFEGVRLIDRHRMVNELLAEELAGSVHALSIHAYTPLQWSEKNQLSPDSPDCMGGGNN